MASETTREQPQFLHHGDYVLATKYCDGDPGDQWAVGVFVGMLPKDGGDRYEVGDADGKLFRGNGFRRAEKITKEEGEYILSLTPTLEESPGGRSIWDWLMEFRYNALRAELAAEREKREGAERDRDDWYENWRVLEKAVVGESAGSAIMTAGGLRQRADRAEAACAEIQDSFRRLLSIYEDDTDAAEFPRPEWVKRALSTDAGRAYAERMERYRFLIGDAVTAISRLIACAEQQRPPHPNEARIAREQRDALNEALQETARNDDILGGKLYVTEESSDD